MSDLKSILKKPQGYVRLILCGLLVLGSIGATPGLKHSNMVFPSVLTIDITVAGGALVAFALLLSGSEGDNPVAEVAFTGIYMVFSFVGSILLIVFLTDAYSDYSGSVGIFILAVALVGGLVLWAIDFALCIKDNFC